MSLLYWLPLNGNLDNSGLSSLSPIPSATPTYNDNGKIGKCFQSGSQYISLPLEAIPEALSICFWVKPNSPDAWTDIFSLGVNDNRMEVVSTITQYYWYCNSTSTSLITHGTALFTLNNSIWNHVCMTADGATVKFYLNGALVKTFSQISSFSNAFGNNLKINIGARIEGHHLYSGYMNDFRIYDHCLSAKEVKEISKGLVCHYKLSGCGGENLVSNSYNFNSWSVGSGWTSSIDFDDGSTVYSFSRTDASSNNWVRLIPTLKVDPNDYPNGITVSLDIKTPDVSAINQKCIGSLQTYQASGSRVGWFEPSWDLSKVVNNQWTRILYTFSQSALKINNTSGTTLSYTQFSFQLVQNGNISIKKIKIEEGSKSTPWCPNSSDALYSTLGFNDGIEYDCSGYGNNGTKVGTIVWSGDTARYSGSYMPTTNSSYISTTLNTSGYANSYTFSYWAKISNMSDKMAFGFSDGNRLNLYPTNSIFCWNTGDSADNPFQNNGTKVTFTSYNGAWHHYAITGNGNTTTLYIDGEKKGTARTYRAITGTKLFLSGWDTGTSYKWTNGNISDFRIYATALSADDIRSLYQVSASIDKSGVLSAYEFVEEG